MDKFKELKNPVTVDFLPKEVKFPKYVLQNTLGKAEAEEMAARFLEFWQEEDQWKAVSMKAVAERMDEQSQDLKKINSEVFTLIIMDAYRIDNGPTFAEIGVRYLVGNKFIDVQRYEEEGEVQIYIAPTDKLLNAIKSFVRK
jgi:hypothetical protein